MPYSYNEVGAILPTENITVTFPFIIREHVHVSVDGVEQPDWSWVNDGLIVADTGFPSGTLTRVYRETPISASLAAQLGAAVFEYGSVNTNDLQLLYAAQEMRDKADEIEARLGDFDDLVDNLLPDVIEQTELAQRWASEAEDVVVAEGEFSSKHHAIKASASSTLASEWADKATDVEVVAGRFSAKHYSEKAAIVNGNIAAALDALQDFNYLADWGSITEAPGEVLDYGSITS